MQCFKMFKNQNSHAGKIYFLPQLMPSFLRSITLSFHLFLEKGSNYCPYCPIVPIVPIVIGLLKFSLAKCFYFHLCYFLGEAVVTAVQSSQGWYLQFPEKDHIMPKPLDFAWGFHILRKWQYPGILSCL